MSGRNQKTLRHFQCRDYLWDVFNQMSQELDTSIDYLINESMRQYARSRNYGVRPSTAPSVPQPSARPSRIPALGSGASAPPSIISSSPDTGASASANPPAPVNATAPPPFRRETLPRDGDAVEELSSMSPDSAPPESVLPRGLSTAPPARPNARSNETLGFSSHPPPLPSRASSIPAPMPEGQELHLVFNGQRTLVDKAEFVIGRSSKSSDFAIRDRNISRRHCAVVQQDDGFWMRDLGSMNGIEFDSRRVESKRIQEGDVFKICDYEIQFTYQ